jgi:hypothetical protein
MVNKMIVAHLEMVGNFPEIRGTIEIHIGACEKLVNWMSQHQYGNQQSSNHSTTYALSAEHSNR